MPVVIRLYGSLAEIAGVESCSIGTPSDSAQAIAEIEARYPTLAGRRYRIAVDHSLIHATVALQENAVIALMPPFSGG